MLKISILRVNKNLNIWRVNYLIFNSNFDEKITVYKKLINYQIKKIARQKKQIFSKSLQYHSHGFKLLSLNNLKLSHESYSQVSCFMFQSLICMYRIHRFCAFIARFARIGWNSASIAPRAWITAAALVPSASAERSWWKLTALFDVIRNLLTPFLVVKVLFPFWDGFLKQVNFLFKLHLSFFFFLLLILFNNLITLWVAWELLMKKNNKIYVNF